jgi:hypothetical protein
MATPYGDIYNRFLSKITDYDYINNQTAAELDETLENLLLGAIPQFRKCKVDLSNRDSTNEQFNDTLSDYEIEILSHLMVVEYMTPHLIKDDFLRQKLSTKDYRMYSQANHIKEIRLLRQLLRNESKQMINSYTYSENSLDDLR